MSLYADNAGNHSTMQPTPNLLTLDKTVFMKISIVLSKLLAGATNKGFDANRFTDQKISQQVKIVATRFEVSSWPFVF
jgi:hypothetical protein